MPAAIPLVVAGISAYSSYRQAKSAGKAADSQKALMGQQSGLANEMSGFARNQMSFSQPALQKAMQHYMTLVSGGRGALNSEIAPDVNAATESYRGAERGMTSSMAPGPRRDRALAELYRSKAGTIGMMPFQAKQNAYVGLENAGNNGMTLAMDAYRGAGSALSGASSTGSNYLTAQQNASNKWGSMVSSLGDLGMGAYDWYRKSRTPGGYPGLPGGTSGKF